MPSATVSDQPLSSFSLHGQQEPKKPAEQVVYMLLRRHTHKYLSICQSVDGFNFAHAGPGEWSGW